jgi:hypothetical protein
MGTDQFWRVLSTLAGDYDVHEGGAAVDVLAEGRKIKDAFGHVVGSKRVVGNRSDGNKVYSRLQNKIRVLKILKDRGIVVADVCSFLIYKNGVDYTVKRTNQKTGKEYKDRKRSLSASEHAAIVRILWEGYAQHLVKYYRPMQLVVLGVGVENAVTTEKLEAIMEGIGGDYLGSLRHPSWNGYYGDNSIVLFRQLQKFGADCIGECNVYDSVVAHSSNASDKESDKELEEAQIDIEEAQPFVDGILDDLEGAFTSLRESDSSVFRLLKVEVDKLTSFGELDQSIAGLLMAEDIMQYSQLAEVMLGKSDMSIADLLTRQIDEEMSHADSHSHSSIPANFSSWLVDDADTLS